MIPEKKQRKPERRTQAERSASMRQRLLEATIACLNERGYAGTSTTLIAERAGVSRGAELHHFPTKADLVIAAIEHVFERHLAEFRAAMQGIACAEDRVSAAIDLLWRACSAEDTRHTWIELVVGTRTDPLLRQKVRETTEKLGQVMVETFKRDVAPGVPLPETAVFVTTALVDGLLLQRMAGADDERALQVLETLKTLARVATLLVRLGDGSPVYAQLLQHLTGKEVDRAPR